MKRPVLILGVEPRITIPIARSLHRRGVPVEVASISTAEPVVRSRAVSHFVRLSGRNGKLSGFLEELVQLITHRGYDMLIPATDAALAAVSEHSACLRELLHVACPLPNVVERVLNKSITLEVARKAGIDVPATHRIANPSQLQVAKQLRFPVVVKPCDKRGEADFKVRHFQTYEQLQETLAEGSRFGDGLLLQEFAFGDGVGIEMLILRGKPLALFQHRRLKEVPATGGAAAVAIAEALEPVLVDQAVALLRALEWEGMAMVEFRYDRQERRSTLMEVNGRYWGTVALATQAGMDFPWYEWQTAHHESPVVPGSYPVGAGWRWTAGYLRRWHGLVKSSAGQTLKHPSLVKQLFPSFADLRSRDALWDFADPLPALIEPLRTARDLAAADVKGLLRMLRPGRSQRTNTPAASAPLTK